MTDTDYEPVRVHIANPEALSNGRQPAAGCAHHRHTSKFGTLNLTTGLPVDQLCGDDDNMCYVLIAAGNNNVVLCESKSEAQAAANVASGQPNPIGAVISSGLTSFTKIPTQRQLWVAAASYTTQVTFVIVYRT